MAATYVTVGGGKQDPAACQTFDPNIAVKAGGARRDAFIGQTLDGRTFVSVFARCPCGGEGCLSIIQHPLDGVERSGML